MLEYLKGFHLELTNICTLKCPRCPRTNFLDKFKIKNWKNENLNLNDLKKFLDIDISGLGFNLNGNYGDPIYYPDLFELIKYIKSRNGIVKISTNGSYKSKQWWDELGSLLETNDVINFSIDGTPENFTQYRVNGDWPSIEQGIKSIVQSRAQTVWKHIIFRYNENTIEQAKTVSDSLGVDNFVIVNSDRWEEGDYLKPLNYYAEVPNTTKFAIHNGNRETPIQLWKTQNARNIEIDPFCKKINTMHFISADGYYMPCCWAGDYRFYYQSDFYKRKDQYNISNVTLSQLLVNSKLLEFYDTIETTKPNFCTFNCPKI